MEKTPILHPRYATDWGVRFLCDCKKKDEEIRIRHGIAHEISTDGIHILSDHAICLQKKVAMQLMIPATATDAPQKIVKIIGQSTESVRKEDKYLTAIKFMHFEENGRNVLERNLHQHFATSFPAQLAQMA